MADLHEYPLLFEMEYDALPGEWKRSGLVGGDGDCLVYTISDFDRGLALRAIITEVRMDEEEDTESYTTEEGDGDKEESEVKKDEHVEKLEMKQMQGGEQDQHQQEDHNVDQALGEPIGGRVSDEPRDEEAVNTVTGAYIKPEDNTEAEDDTETEDESSPDGEDLSNRTGQARVAPTNPAEANDAAARQRILELGLEQGVELEEEEEEEVERTIQQTNSEEETEEASEYEAEDDDEMDTDEGDDEESDFDLN